MDTPKPKNPRDPEIWKAIPATRGYEISTLGRIRGYWFKVDQKNPNMNRTPRMIPPRYSTSRSPTVLIKTEQGFFMEGVAGLMLLTFRGNPPQPHLVPSHIDGDPKNNRLDNLCYESRAIRHLRCAMANPPRQWKPGEKERWEEEICEAYTSGTPVVDIVEKFRTYMLYPILKKHKIPLRNPRGRRRID